MNFFYSHVFNIAQIKPDLWVESERRLSLCITNYLPLNMLGRDYLFFALPQVLHYSFISINSYVSKVLYLCDIWTDG